MSAHVAQRKIPEVTTPGFSIRFYVNGWSNGKIFAD